MALHLEVDLKFPSLDEAAAVRTIDVSREGVFLAMNTPKPIGTTVRLQVRVGDDEVMHLEGIVVRAVPDGAEKLAPNEARGVGVFLTATSPGWEQFCDALAERRKKGGTGPQRVVVVEKVRKLPDGDR